MSAFNWIDFEELCPNCCEEQCIRAQTHVASDYDGDDEGRFHENTYRIGDTMLWWSEDHSDFDKWKNGNKMSITNNEDHESHECCYASCMNCNSKLYAIIRFVKRMPIEVVDIGPEEDWPRSYLK